MPTPVRYYIAEDSIYSQESSNGNNCILENYSIEQHRLSSGPVSDSFAGIGNNVEQSTAMNNTMNSSGNLAPGTGIKIRTRQPHSQLNPTNYTSQGIASRRIRLHLKPTLGQGEEEEVQSAPTKVVLHTYML